MFSTFPASQPRIAEQENKKVGLKINHFLQEKNNPALKQGGGGMLLGH